MHRLETVQDLLGELHDLQILEQTLAAPRGRRSTPTQAAVVQLVRERQRRVYAEMQRGFAGPHAAGVLGPLDLLIARLGGGRRPTVAVRRPPRALERSVVVSGRRRW
jgi:hypothetical protein